MAVAAVRGCRRRTWLAWLLLAGTARAADTELEDSIKAAYLFKFLAYVDWPAAALPPPDQPIVLGIAGADAVYEELRRVLPGRSVLGRPVAVRRVAPGDGVDGLQVLFLGHGVELAQNPWLAKVRERAVLVVTDDPQGLRHGGMLNFVLVQGKLRFEASVASADRSGLKLSSRLLAVAERVLNTP